MEEDRRGKREGIESIEHPAEAEVARGDLVSAEEASAMWKKHGR